MKKATKSQKRSITERKSFRLNENMGRTRHVRLSIDVGFSIEIVAVARASGYAAPVFAQFLAQTRDVDVDGTVEHKDVVAPNAPEHVGAGKHLTRVLQQKLKDFKFGFRERKFLSVE